MTNTIDNLSRGATRRGLLGGAAAFGVAGAVQLWPTRASAAEDFRIGWIKPLTGPLASTFEGYYYAAEIALEEINSAGGIMGRRIVKVDVDDQASPAQEPIVMRKLAEDGVRFVLGPVGSSQALAAFEIGGPRKMLQATYATAEETGDGKRYPYHYGFSSSASAQVKRHVEYLMALKLAKIGILTEDSAAGASVREAIRQELTANKLEIVSDQVFPLRTTDMQPFLRKLRSDGAEALDTHLSNLNDMTQFRIGLNRLNWKPPVVGGAGLLLTGLAGTVPDAALYKDMFAATYRTLTYTDSEQPPARVLSFAKKLLARDVPASIIGAATTSPYYDFLHSLKKGIEAKKAFEPDAVKEYFDSGVDLGGLFGRLSFTPARHFGYEADAMAMAVVASEDEPLAKEYKGIFRRRGPAVP